ncbi:cyclic pyranopterin phosphate synthase [Motilibacter rhizosphaerae]|uniref:GTP 3',8-cyclase n=1 Tax=Motilibacter rhizosphaerae TaxID=598652 RepID=A0A4Q7NG32_9ACTN|nr:GTP 3',8-cyclase MoaA [Motilibacter rhizosphaerae]RZS82775.1 cyclic pyranopterin phosphate synthase [Motilibacter rhizosphaerae]
MLTDRYGRVAASLRLSLTDRCNLRCSYCMPEEGLAWLQREEVLTDDEVVRLVRVAVGLGMRDVRLTGGEPLLRRGLVGLVERLAALPDRPSLALTTNGVGLARLAGPLAAAGLDRVNVSLDTLRRDVFATVTRRDRLDDVLAGLAAARDAGLGPVKVNSVLVRGVNDDEAVPLVEWALHEGYELRIIEQMPLDAQGAWERERMVTAEEVLDRLSRAFVLLEDAHRGSSPAERWWVLRDGVKLGRVGVIASVTRPFCGACDRMRITADGQVRNCLFARGETDLRGLLRGGGSDDDIAEVLRGSVAAKLPGHGIDEPGFLQPSRPMSAIGG